jgi:hypothetical protein
MLFAVVKLSERMDWFDNPNTTGALIAIFAVAVWVLPVLLPARLVVLRELLWWVALVACVCLGKLLLETGSRGGAVAAASGLFLLVLLSGRPWLRWRVAGVAVALVLVGVLAVYFVHPAERLSLAHSIGDASIGNRLRIWKWVPAMVADAPGGWGWGNAPEAFMTWYQDLDHREHYAALVNTHLEWMVEFSWAGRLGYLFAWALALRLAWPWRGRAGERVSPVPVAVLVTLMAGTFFSTVGKEWFLWPVPAVLLLGVVVVRLRAGQWPGWRNLCLSVVAPVVMVAVAFMVAGASSPLRVRAKGDWVKLGRGAPEVTILTGRQEMEDYSRHLGTVWRARRDTGTLAWTCVAREVREAPILVLLGLPADLPVVRELVLRAERVLVIAPRFAPESVFDAGTLARTDVVFGELSSSVHVPGWRETGRCEEVLATGDFLADWVERVLRVTLEKPANP